MTNSTKVIIYDNEGNVILNDSVSSPFIGLQTGETFWYGSDNDKTWAKVISISYGLDTTLKSFVVELVVENTQKEKTKNAKPEYKTIDYGEIILKGDISKGDEWKNKKNDIKIIIRGISITDVDDFIMVVEGTTGPEIEKKDDFEIGEVVICEIDKRIVKCTLLAVKQFSEAKFRITEQIEQ